MSNSIDLKQIIGNSGDYVDNVEYGNIIMMIVIIMIKSIMVITVILVFHDSL